MTIEVRYSLRIESATDEDADDAVFAVRDVLREAMRSTGVENFNLIETSREVTP